MKLDAAVEEKIESIIEAEGFELYEVKFFSAGGKQILRIFADGDNGITLDDCAHISRKVSEYLDEVDFGNTEYTLEVSSPGADRPLLTVRDFRKVIGKKVKVRLREAEKKSDAKCNGTLLSVDEEALTIETKKGELQIALDNVLSGKLDF